MEGHPNILAVIQQRQGEADSITNSDFFLALGVKEIKKSFLEHAMQMRPCNFGLEGTIVEVASFDYEVS